MNTKFVSAFIFTLLLATYSPAQQINYSAPVNKLVPETSFMQNADWKQIFYDASKTTEAERKGLTKEIAIGPDERVFVSDHLNYSISIYDKQGNFIKTFGKQGYGDGEFAFNQDLNGILNDNLLVVSDDQGRINFFDLNGNFVKLITIDFMPLKIFPLKSGNLIIWGHVPVAGHKYKQVLAELNYNTGNYEVFYEQVIGPDQPDVIQMPYQDGYVMWKAPYLHNRKMIRVTADDRVIKANNQTGQVEVFKNQNGHYRKTTFAIKGETIPIAEKEKKEYYRNFKEKLKSRNLDTSYAEKVLKEGFFPKHLPYFYNLITDERSNALFFIYTKNDKQDFAFEAYRLDGSMLGRSEFTIDGFDLLANTDRFIFKNGYIYLTALKQGAEYPLRILKCRVGE